MVKVCCICGDRGFTNALLYCSDCSNASVHQYCLGIQPGSIDDNFHWVCDCCCVRAESVPRTCQKFGGTFSLRAFKSCSEHAGELKTQCTSEIVALLDQPEPICMLFPIQYEGTSIQEQSSNQSQKHGPISSYMEHPDSIMRGLILLVSPSGEVFIHSGMNFCDYSHVSSLASHIVNMTGHSNYIDSEFKILGNDKVKHQFSPLRNNEEYDSDQSMELHERKFRTLDEIYARLDEHAKCTTITGNTNSAVDDCKNLEDGVLLNTSPILDGLKKKGKGGRLRKSYDIPEDDKVIARKLRNKTEILSSQQNGYSVVDNTSVKRKRTVEPEDVTQQKKASVHKVGEVYAQGPSSKKTTRFLKTRKLQKQQSNKGNMKSDRKREFPSEALAPTRKTVRNQIVTMLLKAGWTVEHRRRKKGKKYEDAVYVNPQGKAHYSVPIAYKAHLQDINKGKANKGKVGCGSGNSSSCFKQISKEVLSVLCNRDQRSNKITKSKARKS